MEHTAILMVVATVTRTADTVTLMAVVMATHTIMDTLTAIRTTTVILMGTLMATLMENTQ